MEIAKCSFCLKEVSEVGKTYYEAQEKEKDKFGIWGEKKTFCQNCWPEQEQRYQNYSCDTQEVKREIIKLEISEKTSTSYTTFGDPICYDPSKKEWVKEGKQTSAKPENEPTEKENNNWVIGVILVVVLLVLILFLLSGYLWQKKKPSRQKK